MKDSKLTELRAKTDRQLIAVIGRRLDTGLELARHALHTQAGKAHREALTLLPMVNGLTPAERRNLECKLRRLGDMLEQSAAGVGLQVYTACS